LNETFNGVTFNNTLSDPTLTSFAMQNMGNQACLEIDFSNIKTDDYAIYSEAASYKRTHGNNLFKDAHFNLNQSGIEITDFYQHQACNKVLP
jgi:hypothetical protein